MPYTPQTWYDGSAGNTPISAARLNYMESGIAAAVTGIIAGTGIATSGGLNPTLSNTGVLSVATRTGAVTLTAADVGAGTFPGAVTFASTVGVTGNLTAPNLVYGVVAGSGISSTGGQNPTIANTGVLSVATRTGAVTLTAADIGAGTFPGAVTFASTTAHTGAATFASTVGVTGNLTAPNLLYGVVAGSGIASTGGQNPTLSNTGVLSVATRTGAVTLTAADVGAGTFPGAYTFASTTAYTGTATFNGAVTSTGVATFTSPQFTNAATTAIGSGGSQTSMISSPLGYGIWNDKMRFTLPSVVEVSNTAASPTWTTAGAPTTAFVQANIMSGRTDLGVLQVNSAQPGVRVTWNNTGFNYGQLTNLLFCWTYSSPHVGNITTLWESSADGVTWTSRGTDTRGGLNATWFAMPVTDHGGDSYFRLTLTSPAAPPVAPVASAPTASLTGGTLAAATYYYVVTASNDNGEGVKSNEVSVATTGATSSVSVPFTAGTGGTAPTSYSLYRGTVAGGENVRVATGTTSPLTDTGAAGTAATPSANQAAANLRSFQARTGRPGDQGSGEQANIPFHWDGARNVTFNGTTAHPGAATFSSTLSVTGNLSSGGTISGVNISLSGNLTVTGGGSHGIVGNLTETGQTISQPSTATQVPQIMRGATGQTANLTNWTDPTGATVYASVGPAGAITAPNLVYSVVAGTGISSSGGQNPSIANTGVTSIVAGTNVTVSGATGAVTVNAAAAPVSSVAGRTGAVTLTAADVAAGTFPGASYNFTALNLTGGFAFAPTTTTVAPAAGAAAALPATPTGYMTITVGGTARQVAYY